jgi:hypothetical protein
MGRPYASGAGGESKSPVRFPARAIGTLREFQFSEYIDLIGTSSFRPTKSRLRE